MPTDITLEQADDWEPIDRPEGVVVDLETTDRGGTAALRALQVGAIAVTLVASTNKAFELDRFFVPKELVLHLTAFVAGILALRAFRRVRLTWMDLCLVGFLAFSVASAYFAADVMLAARAVAISVSGVAIFWAARAVREVGHAVPLLAMLAAAVVLGCVTSLLQAYGVETELFSINRAPGGTFGNRNFVAHLAAFGLPVVIYCAFTARRWWMYLLWTVAVMVVIGTLVLTRSRAGWLAAALALVVIGAAMLLSPPPRRHGRTWRRITGILGMGIAGVAAVLLMPNTLEWNSDTPYLESVRDVANYQEGSGAGRLVQYQRSLQITADNPLLGVGPGNWPLVYPDYAPADDPSLSNSDPSTTANPWPSSDWVAFISERGVPAFILLGAAFLGLALAGFSRLRHARDAEEGIAGAGLVATIVGAEVAGAFDAVLLIAPPALLVWAALGGLGEGGDPWDSPRGLPAGRGIQWLGIALLLVLVCGAGVGVVLSAMQLWRIGL